MNTFPGLLLRFKVLSFTISSPLLVISILNELEHIVSFVSVGDWFWNNS